MITNSVRITFNEDFLISEGLSFVARQDVGGTFVDFGFLERWVALRYQNGLVTKNPPTGVPGEQSAIDFSEAFELDYGHLGIVVSRILNVVRITSINPNLLFNDNKPYGSIPPSRADFYFYDVAVETLQITNISYAEATVNNPCTHAKVLITTSQVASNYKYGDVEVSGNTNNPIEIEFQREMAFIFQAWNNPDYKTTQTIETISLLNPDLITVNVTPSPNGAIATITNQLPTQPANLGIEYSLDNENWQTSNTYSGLETGEYTLYIRDSFGCQKEKSFNVHSIGDATVPYFLYDKNNSFRMANRVDWSTGGNYKNDENTLSCEAFARDERLAYKEIQRFQTNDIITTQFKSNYPENKAFVVVDALDTEIEIPVIKKSNYIGLKDLRDGFICNLGNGKNGVYFTTGNIYDFDSGLPTGQDHYLNGSLPTWFGKTQYIRVENVWYLIEGVVYDEYRNAEVIIFSGSFTESTDELVEVGTIYNAQNYEVYEFVIDFETYLNQDVRIRIEANSPDWANITLLSELIEVRVFHKDCVEIRYWNDENTNINYQTGIKHLIRIPINNISGLSEGDFENNKTDTNTILLNSELYEGDSFVFEPLTKELWRKVMRALSCQNVLIDNVRYVKNADFETEGPLEDSNLYVLTANMIKSGGVFNSQSDGVDEFDFSNEEIIGLIDSGDKNYIRY